MMTKSRMALLAGAAAAAVLLAAGCGSSSPSSSSSTPGVGGGAGQSGKQTYTVGLLTDLTGPAASGNKTSVAGLKAGVLMADRAGYTIRYVVADTGSSPTNALTAAQKLVTRDHVTAVIVHSALTFAAASYLTTHRIPVIGADEDGPEWITSTNMFSVVGALHTEKVATTFGQFFKMRGVTNLATVGYAISPISAESAKSTAESARTAGIKVGYLNAQVPFGTTDVQPLVLAMKKAGVDGFFASVDPNTSFALINGLRQAGVDIRAALLPTGYGGDLAQAGPGALNSAQNVYFLLGYEPVEMGTAATKQFTKDRAGVGATAAPSYAEYDNYVSVGLLVRGLRAAGPKATPASLIAALSRVHDFDGLGLYGGRTVDINDRENIVFGAGNCQWFTKLTGRTFSLVEGADPLCGTVIPGKTVSPSS
jgi:ABC-type branched-subunit amino acid transport system substrate-binding protein